MAINSDEISILVNTLGGIDAFSEVTGIDKIDALRILTGYKFDRKSESEIEASLGKFWQSTDVDFETDIFPFIDLLEEIGQTAEDRDLLNEMRLAVATDQITLVDLSANTIWRFLFTRSPFGKRQFSDALDNSLQFDDIKDKVARKSKTPYLEKQVDYWQDTVASNELSEWVEEFQKWVLLGEEVGGLRNIDDKAFWKFWKEWFGDESP